MNSNVEALYKMRTKTGHIRDSYVGIIYYEVVEHFFLLINLIFLLQISSSIWYRLSILLNFLPTEMDLNKIGELIVCVAWKSLSN